LTAQASYLARLPDRTTIVHDLNEDPDEQCPHENSRDHFRRLIFGDFALPYMNESFKRENGQLVDLPRLTQVNNRPTTYRVENDKQVTSELLSQQEEPEI
jgi:hypothetical protein